jgi:hypothetical protein
MPIGTTCRACGAALRPDLAWCGTCFTRVTTFAARPPVHERGTYVGMPRTNIRMSRWAGTPTSMGPLGRIVATVLLLLIFPWWAVVLPLRSVWRKVRIPDGARPTALDRFRERHPVLGRKLELSPLWRVVLIAVGVGAVAVAMWLTNGPVERLVWVGTIVLAMGSLVLASAHDL